jgi:ribosomal protein L31E
MKPKELSKARSSDVLRDHHSAAMSRRHFVGAGIASITLTGLAPVLVPWRAPGAEIQAAADPNSYRNFDVALFVELRDMRRLATDPQYLAESWNVISRNMKVDKVWLETYRDNETTAEADVRKVKEFFASKGIKTSGGMMCTGVGRPGDHLAGFCYSNPDDRERFRKLVAYTAGLFDEIIFDDLFIFNCRCELCQKAKGDMSWTDYRLKVMKEVGETLVVANAKSVNPKVNLIIKPPNWYEQYQFSGYNLEAQPKAFDMIYCGTETRDAENTVMHLQPYQSYNIMRFYEHIKPGKFGGGWVDPGQRQTINRYSEQLEDTLFAKPREITLWCYGNGLETLRQADGATKLTSLIYEDAGDTFDKLDAFLGKLGQPYGVATYKPYNSSGEMYLHNYVGMIGVPMDMYPEFPDDRGTVFLTESAKFDPDLVSKILKHLNADKTVVITTGLLKALQGKGIEKVVEVEYTGRKAIVNTFTFRRIMDEEPANLYHSDSDITIPELAYGLVDSEEIIQGIYKENNRYSMLLQVRGLAKGRFFILTIPENFDDLYHLPPEVLSQIRRDLMQDIPVYLDSPARICLFTYDNNTFIAKSYQPFPVRYNIVIKKAGARLFDVRTDRPLQGYVNGDSTVFEVRHEPRTYNVYRFA